jgi:hypothetical protein
VNGKHGDNPLSDLVIHGAHPFPPDVEEMLLQIDALGRQIGRWPLGENWPVTLFGHAASSLEPFLGRGL